ncbi:uncharacterized protein PITG_18003 [Phytophthora infestans T30-4]|uniref:Transmembrane protein n=1 Tax=Phytophthora infestans (strain T30-4) TaxID=403677 RepID=D0NXH3_PHYIT|nr:uncharacterized protein PITG_18003 [Phytophthora infestans T30-4]EEY67773.1 conserved hypothetical protein [Phytophthora infestans T30-4]|eukprot:XP_002997935.1 conserved hypothetical protein [Phytophthora infestans T30-4]
MNLPLVVFQWLVVAWDAVQIELKGTYSPDRVLALHDYSNLTPWWRIVSVILISPLPCLIYVCLPETVNLSPPSLGMGSNKTFFGRFFLSYTMWCLLQMHMISERMPLLSLSKTQLVISAVTVAILSTGIELLYSWWIGFPVPYTIHMMAVPYVSLMFFALAIVWYPHVRQNLGLLWKIADAILICVCHGLMDSGIERTAFIMVLPVLKTFYRALFYYLCRFASGQRITIAVVFNADMVNALFMNFCMQYQPSFMTTASLMAANTVQVILMTHDIDVIRKQIAQTTKRIINLTKNDRGDRVATLSMLPRAVDIFQRYTFHNSSDDAHHTQLTSTMKITVVPLGNSASQLGPTTDIVVGTRSELEQLEQKYVSLVRKLMYASEFSILTAYAEVITPIVYCTAVFGHMPNRDYYSQIASMDSIHLAKTVVNVLLYSLVELGAFTVLTQTLKRRLNFSTMHQLAFVLDRHVIHVQTASILWVFYTTQISLEHYGTDYSFKFAWLENNSTGT